MFWNVVFIYLLSFVYNIVVFRYAFFILNPVKKNDYRILFFCFINSFMFIGPVTMSSIRYEFFFILFYLLLYTFEFKLLCTNTLHACLFGVLSFLINIFSIRLITLSIIIMIFNSDPSIMNINQNLIWLVTIWSVFVAIPYILLCHENTPKASIEMFLKDTSNIRFACNSQIIITIFMALNVLTLLYKGNTTSTVLFYLFTGIFSLTMFIISILYGVIFCNLQNDTVKLNKLLKEVSNEQLILNKLKIKSNIDELTGVFKRSIALDKIDEYNRNKVSYYVIYADLDGLKIINDQYGHLEGDCYIQFAATCMLHSFRNDVVSRLSGDEFLIVVSSDLRQVRKKIHTCAKDIEQYSSNHNKAYPTSLSFGFVRVDKNNKLNVNQIITLADQKMYESKKQRKKARIH